MDLGINITDLGVIRTKDTTHRLLDLEVRSQIAYGYQKLLLSSLTALNLSGLSG